VGSAPIIGIHVSIQASWPGEGFQAPTYR